MHGACVGHPGIVPEVRIHDGAYGTLLQSELHGDETVDDLCLRAPMLVVQAHRAYLDAGATAIQTNAFLAHVRSSERRRRELQRAALGCALEAIGDAADVELFATLGPAGASPRDFWADLELVLELEAPGVVCETITSRSVADALLEAWRDVAAGVDAQLLIGCSVAPGAGAAAARWVVELASEAPAEVELGLNCCEGPTGLAGLLGELVDARGATWAMPSAGVPSRDAGAAPQWPHGHADRWAEAVARLVTDVPLGRVGGCCGTRPASIASLQAALQE